MTHGGKRAGAGAPKSGAKPHRITIRLSAALYERLKSYPGTITTNVELAIKNYPTPVNDKE